MSDPQLVQAKAALRASAKQARKQASARHGPQAAQKFADIGIVFAGVTPPAVVSGYSPIGDEADISALMQVLHDSGYALALPVIVAKGQPLEFRYWQPGAGLNDATWGIREPGVEAPVVAPDVVLSPLLAFDGDGYRLGYGGGFYDRSLERLRSQKTVVLIGIAFDEQRVDAVPHDRYDQRLDWVLTPSGAKKFN